MGVIAKLGHLGYVPIGQNLNTVVVSPGNDATSCLGVLSIWKSKAPACPSRPFIPPPPCPPRTSFAVIQIDPAAGAAASEIPACPSRPFTPPCPPRTSFAVIQTYPAAGAAASSSGHIYLDQGTDPEIIIQEFQKGIPHAIKYIQEQLNDHDNDDPAILACSEFKDIYKAWVDSLSTAAVLAAATAPLPAYLIGSTKSKSCCIIL